MAVYYAKSDKIFIVILPQFCKASSDYTNCATLVYVVYTLPSTMTFSFL